MSSGENRHNAQHYFRLDTVSMNCFGIFFFVPHAYATHYSDYLRETLGRYLENLSLLLSVYLEILIMKSLFFKGLQERGLTISSFRQNNESIPGAIAAIM